jgi:hypothetical protein
VRRRIAALGIVVWVTLSPGVAGADPPSATNYRTTAVSIEPAAPGIDVWIVGGDSFVMLRADRGTTVEVIGYRGEPFLRFLASGEVEENRASVTYFASRSRYGADVPDDITPSTPPDWRRVAGNGTYAWHDHRSHWMNPFEPPGKDPGDVILEAAVPLVVDGRSTTVTVTSVWEPPPSPTPTWWGAAIGIVLAVIVVIRRRSTQTVSAIAAVLGVHAAAFGWWQFRSVPIETGPSWLMPVLPAVAVAGALAAVCVRRWPLIACGALLLAGVELLAWAWLRRSHLDRAILPTNAPWPLDRAITAAVFVAAAAVVAVASASATARR